jgi:hypothetical protein
MVALQNYVESWGIGFIAGNTTEAQMDNGVVFNEFPSPAYRKDNFASLTGSLLPFLFVLAFVWPLTRLVKQFVEVSNLG